MDVNLASSTQDELVFLPLGGCGEIGMNLNLLGFGPEEDRQWIILDLGITFGDQRTPGIDVIMPDPIYLLDHIDQILGLVLTHGHEDHIGAVAHLWPMLRCPIYATPFTAELVHGKLEEAGLDAQAEVTIVPLGGRITLGPFDIELVTITHSIPEPNALAIRTPLGCVLHTGDWKIDPDPLIGEVTDENALRQFGDDGVLAMLCDSTNVFEPGSSGSEGEVRESLLELLAGMTGRIVVTCFASNVARLDTVVQVAKAHDRHVCLVGRSMHRMVAAAKSVGMLEDFGTAISEDEAGYLPPDKVLYLCTGSQGETRAALSRIAYGDHPDVVLHEGDTVIFSSRVIPGNEIAIYDLQNQLAHMGVRIITDRDHFVHVSGHPCRDELAQMYQWVRPQIAVPVHGEARHLLEHAAVAKELQVPDTVVPTNGSMIRLAPDGPDMIDDVPTGRLFLDGQILVDEDESHLRERRKMAFAGHVTISVAIGADGRLATDPQVRLQGLPELTRLGGEPLIDIVEDDVIVAADRLSRRDLRDDAQIEQFLRQTARRTIRHYWGKKVIVDVVILRA